MKTLHKARYIALTISTSDTFNDFLLNKLKPKDNGILKKSLTKKGDASGI